MESTIKLPSPTRKRMIQLMEILRNWKESKITSADICRLSGWKDSLVRHDLWLIGYNKGVSNGYYKADLQNEISRVLGIENTESEVKKGLCIVGLGRLGAALLDNELLEDSSFMIKAGFDSNLYRVEVLRSNFPLYPASEMDYVIRSEKIEYAILTAANKEPQQMVNRLVKAGIKGIVNMTNVVLKVPGGVKIENVSILNALKLVI